MKKALALISLTALTAASFGCALTDYPNINVKNKSHGVVGCTSDDRIANNQQTVEAQTRELLYTTTLGEASVGACTTGFDPGVGLETVSHEDARDWNRFIADYMFFAEAQVFGSGCFSGTWAMAGLKDLEDGTRRINTWYSPDTGQFTCVGQRVEGRYGGPEGVIVGDSLTRIPRLHVETVSLDNRPAPQFCSNIAALSTNRAVCGYSTYWAFLGRSGEGRIPAIPVTRREGLAEFLGGGTMSVTVQGVEFTGRGQLLADGSIAVDLLGASANGFSYQAEAPVRLTVPADGAFKTVKVENVNDAEMVRLADFALSAGLAGRTWDFQNTVVPELGLALPPLAVTVTEDGLRNFIDNATPGTDRFGG